MFNVLKEQLRKLNKLSDKVVTRVKSSEVYRLFPDKQFVMDFTNHSVFPALDRLDAARTHRFYKRFRGLLIVSLLGWVWKKGLDLQGEVQGLINKIVYKEEKLVKDTSKQLQWVTDTFVLKNPYILNMLASIVISNVCESPKITFMYSRALGRVMAMDYIQNQVNYLVKTPVLKENVLYNDTIYSQMKGLLVGQLRSEPLQDLVKGQLKGLLQSEDLRAMGFRELAMVLRLDVVRAQFVKGIVDEKVYGTLSDKKLAEMTDKSIYKFLK